MGVFCEGTAKAKKSSSQQLGMHAPTLQALLEELQLSVSSHSLYQITGNIIFKSIFGMKNYLTDHLYLFFRANS